MKFFGLHWIDVGILLSYIVAVLVVVLISVILIPFGLAKIGGFTALHEKVPAGLATAEGATIAKTRRIEPVSVYFEEGVVLVVFKAVVSLGA